MIRLQDVTKSYQQHPALRGVTLEVSRGHVFGLIGRSGAGKSTLLRCINLLERPDAGVIEVDGCDVMALDQKRLLAARRRIGMVFQHFNLMRSATVRDNIALPLRLQGTPAHIVERHVGQLVDRLGLGDQQHKHVANLSGGQKQRVGIARALVSEPHVLLCDEATSALDPMATRATLSLLRELNSEYGLTIVVVTHEMAVVRDICDRVAVMDAGRVVEAGDVADLFGRPAQPLTRELVSEAQGALAPPDLIDRYRALPPGTRAQACVVQLLVHGAGSSEPYLWQLMRRHPVRFNILGGAVSSARGTSFGQLMVELRSDTAAALQEALAYLRGIDGVQLDVIL